MPSFTVRHSESDKWREEKRSSTEEGDGEELLITHEMALQMDGSHWVSTL